MDVAFILDAVGRELQLIQGGAVVQIKLTVLPAHALGADAGMLQGDGLGLFQTNVFGRGIIGGGNGAVIVAVSLKLDDLSGSGVDVILILHAAGGEFQLKDGLAVVKVKFAVIPHSILSLHTGVGQGDLTSLRHGDVGRGLAVLFITDVVVGGADVHHIALQSQVGHGHLYVVAQKLQEIVVGHGGAGLDLQHDLALTGLGLIDEVAGLVDVGHQVAQHSAAVLADVVGVGSGDGGAVIIAALQTSDETIGVVFNADGRVDAQGQIAFVGEDGVVIGVVGGTAAGQQQGHQHGQRSDQCCEDRFSFGNVHFVFPFLYEKFFCF